MSGKVVKYMGQNDINVVVEGVEGVAVGQGSRATNVSTTCVKLILTSMKFIPCAKLLTSHNVDEK